MNTRRQFLFDCSVAVAGLAFAPAISLAKTNPPILAGSPAFSYAILVRQMNTVFRVQSGDHLVPLILVKAPLGARTPIRPGRRPPADAGNEKFSLIFSGPKVAPLPAAIHLFEHDALGRFELYIGPIGAPRAGDVRYEAVFNRPAQSREIRTT